MQLLTLSSYIWATFVKACLVFLLLLVLPLPPSVFLSLLDWYETYWSELRNNYGSLCSYLKIKESSFGLPNPPFFNSINISIDEYITRLNLGNKQKNSCNMIHWMEFFSKNRFKSWKRFQNIHAPMVSRALSADEPKWQKHLPATFFLTFWFWEDRSFYCFIISGIIINLFTPDCFHKNHQFFVVVFCHFICVGVWEN